MNKDDGRVVTNFINQALYDQNITIYGDGNQSKNFQYVDDLIEGMINVMNTDSSFHGPINLCNPNEFTVKQLENLIVFLIKDTKGKVVFEDLPQDDHVKRGPDITLAKTTLNCEPKVQLREGLLKIIENFKQLKEEEEKRRNETIKKK